MRILGRHIISSNGCNIKHLMQYCVSVWLVTDFFTDELLYTGNSLLLVDQLNDQ